MLSVREVTKIPKSEGYYRGRMKKNQKKKQTGCSVKSKNGQQEEQCWSREQCSQEKLSCYGVFLHIFLFFPSDLLFEMLSLT